MFMTYYLQIETKEKPIEIYQKKNKTLKIVVVHKT